MGKLTSIYLTPEEDEALRAYCNKYGCTPHSVIKAGLHWMLEEIQKHETAEPIESKAQEEKPRDAKKNLGAESLAKLLRALEKKE